MRMITITPDGNRLVETIEQTPTLSELQAVVEGYIQHVPDFQHLDLALLEMGEGLAEVDVWANEEGLMHGLPVNTVASQLWLAELSRTLRPGAAINLDMVVLVGTIVIVIKSEPEQKKEVA